MQYWYGAMLLVAVCSSTSAVAQTLEVGGMRLTLEAGTITGLTGPDGTLYAEAATPTALGGLRRLDGELVPEGGDTEGAAAKLPLLVTHKQFIGKGHGRLEMKLSADEAAGELVIQQSGSAQPGLHGIQWGIAGIPLDYSIIIPGRSGIKLDRDAPGSYHQFDYPIGWEAQFVIIEGEAGGVFVWAEDAEGRYKNVRVWKRKDCWDIAFGTQNLAPFEDKTEITSVRWRLGVYEGDWRVPARRYRAWAEKAFGLTKLADQQPEWVKDIRLLVICGMSLDLLPLLVENCDPRQTILYVPGWRRDGYDRNYPDYTPVPELAPFIEKAHEYGFKVMLHVNYFGCDPKNDLYEKFEPSQVRHPFSKKRLWWDWERAKPPIKFAYINPARKEWRELFVSRMKELCEEHNVDSLHLDQTLCIWNDANGLIDGMTMIEGAIAEHRELREALPHVALSGEGLNEVAFRYEAFAQRHVWGLSHTEQTWNRDCLECAHPICSYVFLPYTIINGYLGMCPPTSDQLYAAWRQAYVNWGVIPTLGHASAGVLKAGAGFAQQLMDEVRCFQEMRLDPDLDGPWAEDTVFRYRGASGERARYVRKDGFALVSGEDPERVISQTITGVREVKGGGTIGGRSAYDDRRLFGLREEAWYPYFATRPRDMNAFHVSALPERMLVDRVTASAEMAVITTQDRERVFAWISELLQDGRSGYTVFGGEGAEQEGPLETSPGGGQIRPAGRKLITLHPPWKAERTNPETGVLEASGTGQVYAVMNVTLPREGRIEFLSAVYMEKGAVGEGKTDGVTYIVEAASRGETLKAQTHAATATPEPLYLDLSGFAGREVSIRIAADPGPNKRATFDWARWKDARIEVARDRPETMRIVSPEAYTSAITADGDAALRALGGNVYEIEGTLPGSVYLLKGAPKPISLPCDLTAVPFIRSYVSHQGAQLTSPRYAGAGVGEGPVNGIKKRGFSAHPPNRGRTIMDFPITLPNVPCEFRASVGLREGSMSDGCLFIVTVTGKEVARELILPGAWHELEADLSAWAGKPVVLSLITDSDAGFEFDWAIWGEARVVRSE